MKPDPDFRPNPLRSVFLNEEISHETVCRLTLDILKFRQNTSNQEQNLFGNPSDPITLYIDSNGGGIRDLENLLQILKTNDQDGNSPRLISVVTGKAASAAAFLLSQSDYAIAYPNSTIHFHGIRYPRLGDVTMESASNYADYLKQQKLKYGMILADPFFKRLVFRYICSKKQGHNVENPVGHLIQHICNKVTKSARDVITDANSKFTEVQNVSEFVFSESVMKEDFIETEMTILNRIVEFERKRQPNFQLDEDGLYKISDLYLLFRDYYLGEHNSHFKKFIVKRHAIHFLNDSEKATFKELSSEIKSPINSEESQKKLDDFLEPIITNKIRPFWYFTLSLCRRLQESENSLTSRDSYWLGAVDEVMGDPDLHNLRMLYEDYGE